MNVDLAEFLKYSVSQKEVSLIITRSDNEIHKAIKTFTDLGYHQVIEVKEILKLITKPAKILIVLDKSIPKDIYDFIVQYPTGQVEIYDNNNLKSEIVMPIYKDVSIIIMTDEDTIGKSEFMVLEKIGLTYRGGNL